MTMKKFQFDQLINWANELSANKHVWVKCDMIEMFVDFVSALGFNPMGGAFNNDCTEQVIYID